MKGGGVWGNPTTVTKQNAKQNKTTIKSIPPHPTAKQKTKQKQKTKTKLGRVMIRRTFPHNPLPRGKSHDLEKATSSKTRDKGFLLHWTRHVLYPSVEWQLVGWRWWEEGDGGLMPLPGLELILHRSGVECFKGGIKKRKKEKKAQAGLKT